MCSILQFKPMKTLYSVNRRLLLACLLGLSTTAMAQMTLQGQLRTRTEFRNGYGTLQPIGAKPSAFTSQRTSLLFGYKWDRLTFGVNLRDVRVWGQDASTISNADGARLFLHEAWAEITLANRADTTIKFKAFDNLALKIGRQELIYDDVRLLGNLDWLQQGRRFDAALLKAVKNGWQFDLGAGFNQNNEAFGRSGTNYTAGITPAYIANSRGTLVAVPANFIPTTTNGGTPTLATVVSTNGQNQQFKAFQMLYISRRFGQTKFSALFFKDDFQKYRLDSLGNTTNGVVYGRRYDVAGINSRATYGGMLTGQLGKASSFSKATWQAFTYGQSGKNRDGQRLAAYYYGLNFMLQRGRFSIGPGYEVLSGNNTVSPSGKDNRFDPLYGTPHRYWGYMDYFYAGTGSAVGGLANGYIKARYAANPNLLLTLDVHNFALANPVRNGLETNTSAIGKHLGNEIDFVVNYNLSRFTNLEFGYSVMKATNSLEYVKLGSMNRARHNPNWAYLMINIRPDFLYTKPAVAKP